MRLWLDDERDPSDKIIQERFHAKGDETWVKTAEEAIKYLKTGNVTSISLDHDLGTETTGYDVAKYIEQAAVEGSLPKLRCYFHTQNTVGKQNMKAAIRVAYKAWHEGLA